MTYSIKTQQEKHINITLTATRLLRRKRGKEESRQQLNVSTKSDQDLKDAECAAVPAIYIFFPPKVLVYGSVDGTVFDFAQLLYLYRMSIFSRIRRKLDNSILQKKSSLTQESFKCLQTLKPQLSSRTQKGHKSTFSAMSHLSQNLLILVQNAAARVLTRTRKFDHINPVLSTLHWLPTKHRIDFKILLITYKALNGLAPQYLSELLSHYSPSRPLRSQNSGHLIIPRISKSTAGGRSFSYLAPKLWNNLPNTVREADTLCQFKSRLKTHLFNLAYT